MQSKHVAAAAYRADASSELRKALQLSSQTEDVHVKASIEGLVGAKEHGADQELTAAHFVWSLQEKAEKLKLRHTQCEFRRSVEEFACFRVNQKRVDHDGRETELQSRARHAATRHGFHPCEQFAKAEWLCEVVVGSKFQAHDTIRLFPVRADDDDRGIDETVHLSHQIEPTVVWQADVQQDHGETVAPEGLQCLLAGVHDMDDPSVLCEKARHHLAQSYVILHDEDFAGMDVVIR